MKLPSWGDDERWRHAVILGVVALAVATVVKAADAPKIAFYLDRLERSGALYALAPVAIAAGLVILKVPRLSLYTMAFLLPFNTIGGAWGDASIVTLGKIAINLALAAATVATVIAPAAQRAWLTQTRLGHAMISWLLMIGIGMLVGYFSAPNRSDWARETSWMMLYLAVLPAATLITNRRDVRRMLWAGGIGVALMQALGFWMLATGHRYDRPDVQGGEAFFRAPFSTFSVFYLLLALSMFFFASAKTRTLSRRQYLMLAVAIAVLTAGLLATMGRSLWISAAVGGLIVLLLVPWAVSTVRAAGVVAAGVLGAVGLVVLVDSLSPESRGNWTRLAVDFLFALGEKNSVSKLGRQVEWLYAIDLWKLSPVVGYGLGFPFPDNPYNIQVADPFYMHNSFFNVLAKCGALGLLALFWVLAETVLRLLRTFYHPWANLEDRILATALLAALVQVSVLSLFSPALSTTDSVLAAGLLIGLAAAQPRLLSPPEMG